MTETILQAFIFGAIVGVTFAIGWLLGEHREMKRKDKALKIISQEEPNALLRCVKNRYESDLFNGNREN